ncbi:MAG: protein arginine kinase [Candidatus Glassbacteria bacterium RIFCSPLOWO2_12_FULL_58_11]|uniref:Protein-arginine kinase n=1 Tax=Candidatus Glassbacteria bacterium RIFCSPLOWO2_12_FULL_58_11 TaxID=1817867 RepID=A0A1F5YT29_9BACT|nr:MAG: protein arginine kinase [Candidatus Glassbacteria bacterium RIFCSPLOWO2_12_FULL_58_11]
MALLIKDEVPAWLKGSGEHSDVVLSSRVRLARNLKGYQFSPRISENQEEQIRQEVLSVLEREKAIPAMIRMDLKDLKSFECNYLLEEHLISNDLLTRRKSAAVVVGEASRISMMINEEDHLRIQSIASGFDLDSCWQEAEKLESVIGRNLQYEFHAKLGYLTSCPTNTGTGLRASVLIHLPGLVLTKEIQKVLRGITQIGLTFRGLYGEGSEVLGNFFQISNQITIGKSERELIEHLSRITEQIIEHEKNARAILFKDAGHYIQDKVWRAYGILEHSRTITGEEVMNLLSAVRLGVSMKLIKELSVSTINQILIYSQDAHLDVAAGRNLDSTERDIHRATVVRSYFNRN